MKSSLEEDNEMKEDLMEHTGIKKDLSQYEFFTYDEVARILKVKRQTVWTWVYRGLLRKTIRLGKHALIPKVEFERFIKERMSINESRAFKQNSNLPKPLK